jgi:hypothetical protein
MKIGMQVAHKHSYKLYAENCLWVKKQKKNGDNDSFRGDILKI